MALWRVVDSQCAGSFVDILDRKFQRRSVTDWITIVVNLLSSEWMAKFYVIRAPLSRATACSEVGIPERSYFIPVGVRINFSKRISPACVSFLDFFQLRMEEL